MGLDVLPALIPDIGSVYDAYFAAFENTPILEILFPGGVDSPEFRDAHTAHTLNYWHSSSTQYTLKCVDTDSGEIVGMALWDVYVTPSDWKLGAIDWLAGKQKERAEKVILPLWEARERLWKERRYVYCHVVAVLPDHQRRGIGSLLTEWGIRVAEQGGLPIYLESSKEGAGMYKKLGFKTLKQQVVHKGEVLGEREDYTVPLMVYIPESMKKGVLSEELAFQDEVRKDSVTES